MPVCLKEFINVASMSLPKLHQRRVSTGHVDVLLRLRHSAEETAGHFFPAMDREPLERLWTCAIQSFKCLVRRPFCREEDRFAFVSNSMREEL